MPKRDLDLEILRKGRHEDYIDAHADPDDSGAMRDYLTSWLEANKWSKGRWGEFELIARDAGTWKQLAKVRV
jgi:hypothetical protein